jgi:hypothetical protein
MIDATQSRASSGRAARVARARLRVIQRLYKPAKPGAKAQPWGPVVAHRPKGSASADGISSRAIEIAIRITAYPNLGLRSRCVEAGSHAFARCSAESREGVGDAEDAVFDLRDRLDATRLRDGHFQLGVTIRSGQYTERCDEEDGGSHTLGLSPYVQAKSYRCRSRSASSSVKSRHCWAF